MKKTIKTIAGTKNIYRLTNTEIKFITGSTQSLFLRTLLLAEDGTLSATVESLTQ